MAQRNSPLSRSTTTVVRLDPTGKPVVGALVDNRVPYREELYTSEQVSTPKQVASALMKLSRHVSESTQGARTLPEHSGTVFPNIAFMANVSQVIAHKIDSPTGVDWRFESPRTNVDSSSVSPVSVVEIGQDIVNGRIELASSANCIVNLRFWPKSTGNAVPPLSSFLPPVPPPSPPLSPGIPLGPIASNTSLVATDTWVLFEAGDYEVLMPPSATVPPGATYELTHTPGFKNSLENHPVTLNGNGLLVVDPQKTQIAPTVTVTMRTSGSTYRFRSDGRGVLRCVN